MLMLVSLLVPIALIGIAAGDDDDGGVADEEINGNAQDNELEGGMGDDLIAGLGGDDLMHGRAGDDTIEGGEGNDVLQGEDGDDLLSGGDGDDFVTANRGTDVLEGGAGDDWLSGDYGHDTLEGGDDNDTVIGGRGFDRVIGNDGDDVLFGGIIKGAPLNLEEMEQFRDGATLTDLVTNNDQIEMRDDSLGNRLFAGAGDDMLFLGSQDHAIGGLGADTFNLLTDTNGMGAAILRDYDEAEDAITLVVDGPTDGLEVEVVTSTEGETAISVNGQLIGCIMDGSGANLTAADITFVQETDVADLFDPHA